MADRSPPLPDPVIAAWARLLRVSQSLLSAADAALKAQGLPPLAWYDALLELGRAGPEGLRPFELQREMLLEQYNLSRLIDRLAAAGLVERLPCPDDGRGHILKITPEGNALQKRMWPVYRSVIQQRFADRIGEADAAELGAILARLAED